MKFLRKSVTVTARYCLLFIVERKYDLRQPEDISGKELSGGILLHTEIPPFYVDVMQMTCGVICRQNVTTMQQRRRHEKRTGRLLRDTWQ